MRRLILPVFLALSVCGSFILAAPQHRAAPPAAAGIFRDFQGRLEDLRPDSAPASASIYFNSADRHDGGWGWSKSDGNASRARTVSVHVSIYNRGIANSNCGTAVSVQDCAAEALINRWAEIKADRNPTNRILKTNVTASEFLKPQVGTLGKARPIGNYHYIEWIGNGAQWGTGLEYHVQAANVLILIQLDGTDVSYERMGCQLAGEMIAKLPTTGVRPPGPCDDHQPLEAGLAPPPPSAPDWPDSRRGDVPPTAPSSATGVPLSPRQVSVISSTFDRDADGWGGGSFPDNGPYDQVLARVQPQWSATGGDPGGAIFIVDPGVGNFFFDAPPAYLGDQRAFYGGRLEYGLKTEGADLFDEVDVVLLSPGATLVYHLSGRPSTAWATAKVSLTEVGWRVGTLNGRPVTATDFQRALGNITALRIRGEFRNGRDTGWLDNVRMIPPSTAIANPGGTSPATTTPPQLSGAPTRVVNGAIHAGPAVQVASAAVPAGGGTVRVNRPGDPLNGFTINVPAGAYRAGTSLKVSYQPVTSHTFGRNFNPLSPLITVDNGGAYADELMTLTVPIKVPEGHFAMGFYYDSRTGKLEGIPWAGRTAGTITLATRHYCEIIVASMLTMDIPAMVDSGFRPGLDDWEFPNWGSFIEQNGHCAGQSGSALWYFVTKPDGPNVHLFNRYDRNGSQPATPNLWFDDSFGYRLASVVQHEIKWDSLYRQLSKTLSWSDPESTWRTFAYTILLTGEPQFVAINGDHGGHAMIVYLVKDRTLYIADPNFPGDNNRRIEWDAAAANFKPYHSAANAAEIAAGLDDVYGEIAYIAKTAAVDWNQIGKHWTELKTGTIGDAVFPAYRLFWVDGDGQRKPLADGAVIDRRYVDFAFAANGVFGQRVGVVINGAKAERSVNGLFELHPGRNEIGLALFNVRADSRGNESYEYIDFKYVNVTYSEAPTVVPAPQPGRTLGATTATSPVARIQQARYIALTVSGQGTFQSSDGKTSSVDVSTGSGGPITWSGASFRYAESGTYPAVHGDAESGAPLLKREATFSKSLTGTISQDGSTLIELTYTYRTSSGDYDNLVLRNVPLASNAPGQVKEIVAGFGKWAKTMSEAGFKPYVVTWEAARSGSRDTSPISRLSSWNWDAVARYNYGLSVLFRTTK